MAEKKKKRDTVSGWHYHICLKCYRKYTDRGNCPGKFADGVCLVCTGGKPASWTLDWDPQACCVDAVEPDKYNWKRFRLGGKNVQWRHCEKCGRTFDLRRLLR